MKDRKKSLQTELLLPFKQEREYGWEKIVTIIFSVWDRLDVKLDGASTGEIFHWK